MPFLRTARPTDAPAIAALHARNWQQAYRGDLPDHYLDVKCPAERLRTWTERFATPNPKMHCAVFEDGGRLAGFCCTFDDYDAHGAYLDNLHVADEYRGQGLGEQLLRNAARRVNNPELYLVVLTSNVAAIRFYERLNARRGAVETRELAGLPVEVVGMHWETADLL